jgi:hypothetical protein
VTFLLICPNCTTPITGQWKETNGSRVHADAEECARLLAHATDPVVIAAQAIGKLVTQKREAYGSSYAKSGDFLRLLYPDGVKPYQYSDMLLLVRIFDKQMRIATDKDALGEDPFIDIAGYGILGVVKDA